MAMFSGDFFLLKNRKKPFSNNPSHGLKYNLNYLNNVERNLKPDNAIREIRMGGPINLPYSRWIDERRHRYRLPDRACQWSRRAGHTVCCLAPILRIPGGPSNRRPRVPKPLPKWPRRSKHFHHFSRDHWPPRRTWTRDPRKLQYTQSVHCLRQSGKGKLERAGPPRGINCARRIGSLSAGLWHWAPPSLALVSPGI